MTSRSRPPSGPCRVPTANPTPPALTPLSGTTRRRHGLGRCRLADAARRLGLAACAGKYLRTASGFVDAPPGRQTLLVAGTNRASGSLCRRTGLHPSGTVAGDRKSARRSGARQGFSARQGAGRCLAVNRQPAPAVRLAGLDAGQEADLHGLRIRPAARMVGSARTRLGPAGRSKSQRPAASRRLAIQRRCKAPTALECRRPAVLSKSSTAIRHITGAATSAMPGRSMPARVNG